MVSLTKPDVTIEKDIMSMANPKILNFKSMDESCLSFSHFMNIMKKMAKLTANNAKPMHIPFPKFSFKPSSLNIFFSSKSFLSNMVFSIIPKRNS